MANFDYIKGSLAGWANNTGITQADLWQLDQNQHDAINGVGGGTWAPSAVITIGGQGIYMTGPFETEGAFSTYGDTFIGSDATDALIVTAESTFNATVTCTSNATFSSGTFSSAVSVAGTFTAGGNATLGTNSGNSLTVNSIANLGAVNVAGYIACTDSGFFGGTGTAYTFDSSLGITGPLSVGDTASIAGTATFGGAGSFAGQLTAYGRIRLASLGRVSQNLVSDSLTGNVSYSVDGGSRTYMGYTALNFTDLGGAARDLRLYDDGAASGDQLEVKNSTAGTAYNLNVKDAGGGAIGAIGQGQTNTFMFDGSAWIAWSN